MFEYNKRLVEVDEILSLLSESDYNKIPKEIIQVIKENKAKDYVWEYDETKPLKDQNVSRDTIAFLSFINMEYLMNDEQKNYIQKLHENNEFNKLEREYSKQQANNYGELFKKREEKKEQKVEENALIMYKETFWKKILNKLKSLFKFKS